MKFLADKLFPIVVGIMKFLESKLFLSIIRCVIGIIVALDAFGLSFLIMAYAYRLIIMPLLLARILAIVLFAIFMFLYFKYKKYILPYGTKRT